MLRKKLFFFGYIVDINGTSEKILISFVSPKGVNNIVKVEIISMFPLNIKDC